MSDPSSTEAWARSLDISIAAVPPPVADAGEVSAYSAQDLARRALLLQAVVATASGVASAPIIAWLKSQDLLSLASPNERAFLEAHRKVSSVVDRVRWRQEAEWTLLWAIGMVESLGLPVRCCDTRRLVDEILPPLGDSVEPFLERAVLRPASALLAEDDRTYNLWCHAKAAERAGASLPRDLNMAVLYQRRYAFEWLGGFEEWDLVACDA